jgi:ABC-type oligopeptide transport system substrate-binding subunit/DNA-binding SARP family transcriptional activator
VLHLRQKGGGVTILQFRFLGPLEVRCGDRQLPKPPTLKSQSLLAYLVLHRDQPQPRERLAGMFWGDRPERKARSSLATALWHTRRCLPDEELILGDLHTVQFHPQAELWLDVEEFEARASAEDVGSLESAVALYRGDFLDGFYDDWVINQRYRLEGLFLEVLARLMAGRETGGEHQAALETALHLLGRDPLREEAHRVAMRAYCRLGQRNASLEQYHRCREIVLEELGAEPMVETTQLYRSILEGRFEIGPPPEMLPLEVSATEPAGRSPLDVIAPVRLVGRERELVFLQRCWRRAQAQEGGLGLISGEAGVGKTRLVEAFADRVRWEGVRVLWGRCYELERALPYQPLTEALRTIPPALTSDELAGVPAWAIAQVARLMPEVLERPIFSEARRGRSRGIGGHPGLQVAAAPRLDQERARLFEGVTRFVAELSSHRALLVVLEDLHWASESTLQLVHYLTRHLAHHPVLIVSTFRPEAIGLRHPLRALRRQLTQEGLAHSLRLSRLSPEAVETMVLEMSGAGEVVVTLAERLYEETEGNPFFLMEIVKALFETNVLRLEEGVWQGDFARISEGDLPLPASVSEAIQARVQLLQDDGQDALRLAAVLGREFDFELLNAVFGRGEEATLEALDALLRHRLVDEGSGAVGRDYVFTHHKIQEVVYDGIPRRHRQLAHAWAGKAIERLYGPQVETLVGELAYHFEQGGRLDKALTEKAIHYLLQAGDRARGRMAPGDAIDYYQRALALLKEQSDHEGAARTLMKLGLTYHIDFDFQQARRAYEEGFALWQRAGTIREGPPPPAPHALRMAWFPPPTTLDPAMSQDIFSAAVIDQLFSGLVAHSSEMDVVPEVAGSWEVLEGGRKYIFHLRDDVVWSDGPPVTAKDFEYAWKRVLAPATGSPNASLLYDVKGAKSFHRGQDGMGDVGVRALDEVTLVVELEGPTSFLLHLLAHSATYPVPRHVVEARGRAWTGVQNIVTNGPFGLEACNPGESIILSRNPVYHGRCRGNLQRVELSFLADPCARLSLYEADGSDILDMTFLPPAELDDARRRHAGEYVVGPRLWTSYLGFGVGRPPFDDVRLRRAFALATDRETLAEVVLRGHSAPATGGFIPPGMPGHSPHVGVPYNPDRARQLLAEAGYPGGRGFPAVELLARRGHESQSEYLKAQWRENLGVDAELTWATMEYETFFGRLRKEPPSMFLLGWVADYPDPDNFLRISTFRHWTRWRNEAYDRLVEEARRFMDQGERMRLYERVERILIEEAAILPLYYSRLHLLVKPWVRQVPVSAMEWWFWKDIVIEPH